MKTLTEQEVREGFLSPDLLTAYKRLQEDWLRQQKEIETLRRDLENCDAAYRSLADPGIR